MPLNTLASGPSSLQFRFAPPCWRSGPARHPPQQQDPDERQQQRGNQRIDQRVAVLAFARLRQFGPQFGHRALVLRCLLTQGDQGGVHLFGALGVAPCLLGCGIQGAPERGGRGATCGILDGRQGQLGRGLQTGIFCGLRLQRNHLESRPCGRGRSLWRLDRRRLCQIGSTSSNWRLHDNCSARCGGRGRSTWRLRIGVALRRGGIERGRGASRRCDRHTIGAGCPATAPGARHCPCGRPRRRRRLGQGASAGKCSAGRRDIGRHIRKQDIAPGRLHVATRADSHRDNRLFHRYRGTHPHIGIAWAATRFQRYSHPALEHGCVPLQDLGAEAQRPSGFSRIERKRDYHVHRLADPDSSLRPTDRQGG